MTRAVASMGQRGQIAPPPDFNAAPPPPMGSVPEASAARVQLHGRSLAETIAYQNYYYANLTHQSQYVILCRSASLFNLI